MTDYSQMSDAQLEMLARGERPGAVEDSARAIPGALRDAVAGTLGAPVDIINLLSRAGVGARNWLSGRITMGGQTPEWAPVEAPQIPAGGSDTFRGAINDMAGAVSPTIKDALNYQPQTPAGRITRGVTEFAAGAAIPARALGAAPGTVGRLAGIGGAAGAVTEGADLAMERAGARPETRAAVRMGLGGATMALGNRSAAAGLNATRMLRDRLEGIRDPELRAALGLERDAATMGTPLFGGEPLGPVGSRVQQLTSNIRQTPQGTPIDRAFAARQGQVQQAVAGPGGMLERISPDADPAIAAADRTRATRPLYEAADLQNISPQDLAQIVQAVDDAIARVGSRSDIGRQLAAYRTRLTTPEAGPPGTPGQPNPQPPPGSPMQVGPVATLYQETREGIPPADTTAGTMQARTRGVLNEVNPQLGQTLEAVSPEFAQAQQRFRDMSPRVEAAQTRQTLAERFNEALRANSVSPNNPTVGARFSASVRGPTGPGNATAAELDDAIRQAATARGVPPDQLVAQINRQLDILAAQGQIPGSNSATAGRISQGAETQRNAISTIARVLNLTRGSVVDLANSAAAGMVGRATNRRLADVLSAPDGVQQMVDMLSRGPRSELTQIQLSNLGAALRGDQQDHRVRLDGRVRP